MKKTSNWKLVKLLLIFVVLALAWAITSYFMNNDKWKEDTWQWAYYKGWTEDKDIVRWPVFSSYQWCKDRAYYIELDAYDQMVFCSKNCHDSKAGTPICEEVVRSRQPIPWFWVTFADYKE